METGIIAGTPGRDVPEMVTAGGEWHERAQVLVLSAAYQLYHVYRDRTLDYKA